MSRYQPDEELVCTSARIVGEFCAHLFVKAAFRAIELLDDTPEFAGYLKPAQAAKIVDVSPVTLKRWAKEGKLEHRIINDRWHYSSKDLMRIVEEGEQHG